ncbi:hypothetical protein GRI89_09610 [Altererythrobacter salegens]|uniref:Uncharacterized protein n=1 Tax=Croceibacterium salegens TaxID=1737568 RepID=A0A6I4SUW2_9SPHN|nr:hypothetical protein [Croceibacterium salegens]MXO59795.1 hypothetical protein [Croceibacterium salegens]
MIRSAAAAIAAAALLATGPVQAEDATQADRVAAFAKLPYWPGFWVSEKYHDTTITGTAPQRPAGSPPLDRLNGFDAPWNAEGKARQAEDAKTRGSRGADGWGYPMMMDAATPFQVMITPEETLIVNAYGETRHIYTDGRELPAAEDMWPTVWGTSIGHWDGDTLVIETVQVQSPAIYFHGAPTFSEDAKYHERMRLEGERLAMSITVEDPTTLTGPWSKSITYLRETGFDRMIQMDFSNDRTDYSDGVGTIDPPKD